MRVIYLFVFTGFILSLFALYSNSVVAQDLLNQPVRPKDEIVSAREKAILAFFRLSGQAPDYQYWITSSNAYQKIEDESVKEKFYVSEALRLGRGLTMFDHSEGFLDVKAEVAGRYVLSENAEPRFKFQYPGQASDYVPVFTYPYGKHSIVLVINKLKALSDIPLSDEQFKIVQKMMREPDEEYMSEIVMQVRPVRADINKPIVKNGIKKWVMTGEIAYMDCFVINPLTLERQLAWNYVAPWYKQKYEEKLKPPEDTAPSPFDLFKNK